MKRSAKIFSAALVLLLVVGLLPGMSLTAYAEGEQYTLYSTVKFNNINWYIIADNSSAASGGTVTLFAVNPLGASKFNDRNISNANVYSSSAVKGYLDGLTSGSFTGVADAIADTTLSDVGVTAKLYLLSSGEADGLPDSIRKCSNTVSAEYNSWWLRTKGTNSNGVYCVSGDDSRIYSNIGVQYIMEVRPALRLDLSEVTFDSSTNTFAVPVDSVTLNKDSTILSFGDTETLEATVTSNNATNKNVTWTSDNTAVATVSDAGVVSAVGVGTANITVTTTDGSFTAICAVTVNKADNPMTYTEMQTVGKTFSAASQTATLEAAADAQGAVTYAIYSQKNSAETDVTYFSLDGTTLTLAANTPVGTYTVDVRATAAGNNNYESGTKDSTVTVTVSKANSTPATVTANNRTYDGTEKPLVNVDDSSFKGGEMQYALGNETEATASYAASIPTATNAGTYYVWYKTAGNENYNDSEAAKVEVTISKADPAVPTGLQAKVGQKLSDVTLPSGWKWDNYDTELTETGDKTFPATFTESTNCNGKTADLTVTVSNTPVTGVTLDKTTLTFQPPLG